MNSRTRTVGVGRSIAVLAAVLVAGLFAVVVNAQNRQINGAGATFPFPIYSKWFSEYNKLHPNIQINYQSIGSGGGVKQLASQTVFFGATDGPMTNDQLRAAPGAILHFPTVLGAVVPIYHIDGVNAELKFTGPVLADIFLGKITRWNDPALVKLNAGVRFPDKEIVVVHRSDGSGTTYIFADYLAKISPEWKKRVGVNTALNWPAGTGGKGNEGVSGYVKEIPNSIGDVELIYALENHIAYGAVQNAAGTFLRATIEGVTAAAAASASAMPADFRVSITNAPGGAAYPISSFTWMIFYENPKDKTSARTMVEFMKWALTDGQSFTKGLGYAPLPEAVVRLELEALQKIKL